MASTAIVNELPVKSENVDYVRFIKGTANATTNKTDWDVKVLAAPSEAVIKDLQAKGYSIQATQTVIVTRAGSPEGFEQIVSDPEERTNVFNRGVAQKLQQKVTANLGDSDDEGKPTFTFSEAAYDPSEWLNEATSRRNLSPEEKAARDLAKSGLSQDVIKAMLAVLRNQ
jgi:hypothetical protein